MAVRLCLSAVFPLPRLGASACHIVGIGLSQNVSHSVGDEDAEHFMPNASPDGETGSHLLERADLRQGVATAHRGVRVASPMG